MIDIKSLFLTAKSSGAENDIDAYTEAVDEAFINSPRDYVAQLEYIIQSSYGIQTLIPFIEKWGIPLALYDTIYEGVKDCIAKSEKAHVSADIHQDAKSWLEHFRRNNIHCFAMYEYYRPEDVTKYIETYYGFTKGNQNRVLAAGMIKSFGEYAIPDVLITADTLGTNAKQSIVSYLESMDRTPMINQWLTECFADINHDQINVTQFIESSANTIISKMHNRHHDVFRESMILNESDAVYEYTNTEVEALYDLISFKEYMLTWSDETGDDIRQLQQDIYHLYEEAESIQEKDEKDSDKKDEKKDSDFVPIFCVLQSYTHDETDNYGNKKSDVQKSLADINKVIRFMTKGDKFTHALISLDDDLKEMYSFGSLGFEKAPIEEDSLWVTTDEIYTSVMFITKEEFESVKSFIMKMKAEEADTKYAYSNLVKMFVGRPVINNKRNVCSTFTACVLQHANPKLLHRDYSRMRPEDLTIIPRSFYVMTFKDRDDFLAKKSEFKQRVKVIKEEHIDEIKDYNNDLPKIMLKEQMDKLHTFDKIIDFFASKGAAKMNYKKKV